MNEKSVVANLNSEIWIDIKTLAEIKNVTSSAEFTGEIL